MNEYLTRNNQNPIDVSMTVYGGMEGLLQLWEDNEDLLLTADLSAETPLSFDANKSFSTTGIIPEATIEEEEKKKSVTAIVGQNLIDLAIDRYGSFEGIKHLINDNEIEADHQLSAGDGLYVRNRATNVLNLNYLKAQGVIVRTGLDQPKEENFWIGKGYFVVDGQGNEILITNE